MNTDGEENFSSSAIWFTVMSVSHSSSRALVVNIRFIHSTGVAEVIFFITDVKYFTDTQAWEA